MVTKEEIEAVRLKPIMCACPFCGSYDVDPEGWLSEDADGTKKKGPACDDCGASAPSVEAWNERAVTTEMVQIGIAKHQAIAEATMFTILDAAVHSNREIAHKTELAELWGLPVESEEFQELEEKGIVETERGAWVRRTGDFWEHIRTAEY